MKNTKHTENTKNTKYKIRETYKKVKRYKNSPGQQPTACKIFGTSPCTRFPVLRITGLQNFSPVRTP